MCQIFQNLSHAFFTSKTILILQYPLIPSLLKTVPFSKAESGFFLQLSQFIMHLAINWEHRGCIEIGYMPLIPGRIAVQDTIVYSLRKILNFQDSRVSLSPVLNFFFLYVTTKLLIPVHWYLGSLQLEITHVQTLFLY